MSDLKNSVIESVKNLLLPELKKLHEGQNDIRIRQEAIEKQLVIMNENILSNSRRIDDVNKRIDDTNKRFDEVNRRFDEVNRRFDEMNQRIDDTNVRIDDSNKRTDSVYVELGYIRKELECLKRDEVITGDIIHRVEILEGKVLLGK